MNTLWPLGEGTVRDIRDGLAARRPRAYTTIMTIMDRLARKGVVERRKVGRAYIYRPHLTAEEARSQAVGQLIEGFFGGSKEALLAELRAPAQVAVPQALAVAACATFGHPTAGGEIGPAATKVVGRAAVLETLEVPVTATVVTPSSSQPQVSLGDEETADVTDESFD